MEEPRDTFVVPLKSQRANERENATFECDLNDKDIDVEWWHDGKKIKMDGRHFKVNAQNGKYRMICSVMVFVTITVTNYYEYCRTDLKLGSSKYLISQTKYSCSKKAI